MMIRKFFYTCLSLVLIPFSLAAQGNHWFVAMEQGYHGE